MSALARSFADRFTGDVITPDDDRYTTARAVWNGTVDSHPALIARCQSVDDIAIAITLTRDAGLPLAIRAGGHSVAGLSVCDGGVVLDLSLLRRVTVDPERRIAVTEPGATWRDYDAATAEHNLASTGGLVSTTGVAGLTLGGGIGWLQRRCGLACDNLVAADVVTADGEIVHASIDERPELLWGLRGGGGNFGVVSRFEFALHPVSTVLAGLMLFPIDRGPEVLTTFRAWAEEMPDEGSMLAAVMTAPPAPFVPPHLDGQKVIAIVGCWCGDMEDGAAVLEPMRGLKPDADVFGPVPYPALQQMLDDGAPPGLRNYFRGGFLQALGDDVIDIVLDRGARLSSPMSAIHLHQMGGAVGRVGVAETAFSGRAAAYTYNLVSTWTDRAEDERHITENRDLASALAPHSQPATYVNFLTDGAESTGEGEAAVRAAYGEDLYARLARLKREYDPHNLFRVNQNVRPAR